MFLSQWILSLIGVGDGDDSAEVAIRFGRGQLTILEFTDDFRGLLVVEHHQGDAGNQRIAVAALAGRFPEMLFRTSLVVGALKRIGQGQASIDRIWLGLDCVLELDHSGGVVAFFHEIVARHERVLTTPRHDGCQGCDQDSLAEIPCAARQ